MLLFKITKSVKEIAKQLGKKQIHIAQINIFRLTDLFMPVSFFKAPKTLVGEGKNAVQARKALMTDSTFFLNLSS